MIARPPGRRLRAATLASSYALFVFACAEGCSGPRVPDAPPSEETGRASAANLVDASPNDAASSAIADARAYDALDGSSDARDGSQDPHAASTDAPQRARVLELGLPVVSFRAKKLSWRRVSGLNWQAIADDLPPLRTGSEAADAKVASGRCPAGMVAVEGNMLVDRRGREDTDDVERAQDKTCETWRVPGRVCDKFSEEKWKESSQAFPRKKMQFCIDRFEYPNRLGEYPLVVATYAESAAYCAREKKRLCTETEWTFACEGEEGRPYPYGYVRDATACPLDRPRIEPDDETFAPRTTARTAKGIDTMWKGERSGAFARCTSPFGVRDTTGNVDEWTTSVRSWGYRMILKGGHWSPVRGRCRPQTRGHGPLYVNVETGFRCCS